MPAASACFCSQKLQIKNEIFDLQELIRPKPWKNEFFAKFLGS